MTRAALAALVFALSGLAAEPPGTDPPSGRKQYQELFKRFDKGQSDRFLAIRFKGVRGEGLDEAVDKLVKEAEAKR